MTSLSDPVRTGYDLLAPAYDLLTGEHNHAAWAELMAELASRAGPVGPRLLDVGCGTGNSLVPMVARGYEVAGVDVSPGMIEIAREKLGPDVPLVVADMRELPAIGEFDLVWSLGDAVNHLLTDEDLAAAFSGFRRNLATGGVLAFDVDTLTSFRALYTSLIVVPGTEQIVVFEGREAGPIESGALGEAWIDHLVPAEAPWWRRVRSVHRQRHHSREAIERALDAAGLRCVAVWGTDGAGAAEQPLDELRHTKAMYIAHAVRR